MRSIPTEVRGFTLVEAVAVIVITGIIAAVVAVFIAKPVQGYVDAVRRAALTDLADSTLRRIAREARLSLPNSVRVNNSGACATASAGSGCYLEFIPTKDGVRYRTELTSGGGNILDFTSAADTAFDVFGNGTLNASVAAGAADFVVIFNTGQCSAVNCPGGASCAGGGAQAYEGCNRRQLTAITNTGGNTTNLGFTATSYPFPFDSPGHRVHVVPATGPVSFACEAPTATETANGVQGPLVLHRYTGYNSGAGVWSGSGSNAGVQPTSFTGPNATLSVANAVLMADSISACGFTYNPSTSAVTARSGLLSMTLTFTRSGESVTLYHEIHVENQP